VDIELYTAKKHSSRNIHSLLFKIFFSDFLDLYTVAYLRHVRTVTSKHVPAITQQLKRFFLRAEASRGDPNRVESRIASRRMASPRLLSGNSYKHLDDARVGKGHVTASAVTSRVSTVTQQLERFPHVRSWVYRRD
jgi:hypothetical protein